jgi:hypothetical protein
VEAALPTLLTVALTLLGSGLLQRAHDNRIKRSADRKRLEQALSAFGAALDALILELQQLPPATRRAARGWQRIERQAPGIDFLAGRLARVMFGKELYAAIERTQVAANDLMLGAPSRLWS